MQSLGTKTETANNGEEAVTKAFNNWFDIIIMDLEMPVMNGFVATSTIKQQFQGKKSPWIVAFTSNTLTSDLVQTLRQANFDDWFTTPVSQHIINTKIIKKVLDSQRIEKEQAKEQESPKETEKEYKTQYEIETINEENELDEQGT